MQHACTQETCTYVTTSPCKQGAWDVGTDEELYAAFRAFASFGGGTPKASAQPKAAELDGKGFVKMCRDSGLTDCRLTTTAIDLIFSRVRGKVGPSWQSRWAVSTVQHESCMTSAPWARRQ